MKPFTWGTVTNVHEIGRYRIIEYLPKDSARHIPHFHLYVNNEDTNTSFSSLDTALIAAVAFGRFEPNEARWMAIAASKLMEVKS